MGDIFRILINPSWSNIVAQVRDDRASKANGPATVSISEEDTLQRVLRATTLGGPMRSAVNGVNDCSLGAHRPAFQRIDKLNVKKIDVDCRLLSLPGAAAVYRAINDAATTHGPSLAIVDKRSSGEASRFFNLWQG